MTKDEMKLLLVRVVSMADSDKNGRFLFDYGRFHDVMAKKVLKNGQFSFEANSLRENWP